MPEYVDKLIKTPRLPAPIIGGQVLRFTANYKAFQSPLDQLAAERTAREAAEKRADYDHLTGLYNRHALAKKFDEKVISAQRNRHQRAHDAHAPQANNCVSFLMFDLDHFKQLNDTRGHDYGDLVLQEVAGILGTKTRQDDPAFRLGGEEIGLLISEDADGAAIVAQKIRSAVRETGKVTVSVGIVSFDADNPLSLQDAYKHADTALYAAKHGTIGENNPGRDQVVNYSQLEA